MELMQKRVKEGGAVGVDDLSRWPYDSDAVCFLSETTSASSVIELMKVSQISPLWSYNLTALASVTHSSMAKGKA
jgi:hypothetical protein